MPALKINPELCDLDFVLGARRLAQSIEQGCETSPFCGTGSEFLQSRPYQRGDPVRLMDWRALARTGRLMIKGFESPRRESVYLIVDRSASMTLGSQDRTKYQLAVQIAGGLAFACLQQMYPMALLGSDAGVVLAPTSDPDAMQAALCALRHFRLDERTPLNRILRRLREKALSDAVVIILSDFCDPSSLDELRALSVLHDLIVIHCVDPAQDSLGGAGWTRVREAERARFGVRSGAEADGASGAVGLACRKLNADYLMLATHQNVESLLKRFLRQRARSCHANAL